MTSDEARYPEYRGYTELRNTVNTAIMALLAGSRLANHTLALTAGSDRTLAEIFPAVEHIRRFNLRTDVAQNYLGAADSHLASMAITYTLAIHEDFVLTSIAFAKSHGIAITSRRQIKAWNMHAVLFGALNYQPSSDWIECFHLLRHMRNSVAHAGGRPTSELNQHIPSMAAASVQQWQRLNKEPPAKVVQNGVVVLNANHIFCALAVIKDLGRQINRALQSAISTGEWGKICVSDYAQVATKHKNSISWQRQLIAYARRYYRPLQLPQGDLEAAARALGFWTIAQWF